MKGQIFRKFETESNKIRMSNINIILIIQANIYAHKTLAHNKKLENGHSLILSACVCNDLHEKNMLISNRLVELK